MRSFHRNKQGQFVVIAALIIAVLALATIISVYEISMTNQSIVYKPVDEFLLGTTSDMNRALTVALSRYSLELVNGQEEAIANSSGQQFMEDWQQSLFSSYPNYGFKLNQPISTYFDCRWSINPGYSSALTTYDFDVVSYGFLGWAGQTYKYVQLQLLNVSRDGSDQTNVTFQLTQSMLNKDNTVPISDMPQNPDPSVFQIGAYTAGEPFNPVNTTSILTYLGNGVYSAVFNQTRDLTQGIRLDLMTNDRIWVSATLNQAEGSTDSPVTPTLTTTPPSYAVVGQAFADTAVLTGATADASGTVTYKLYSGTPGAGIQIGQPSVVNVANGQVPDSALYSAFSPGPYYFVASYSGDANNNPVQGSPEPFTVNAIPPPDSGKANPTITTTPPTAEEAIAGTPFHDMAILTEATSTATGKVTYTLFKGTYPNGNQISVSQVPVTNGVVPNSASFTVNTAGPYYFIAVYSGDNNNNAAMGTAEPFTVGGSLRISTTPPSNARAGSEFSDQALLIGATDDASGTVTYKLYSGTYPSGTLVGTSQVTVSNGVVPNSSNFTVYTVGPYYFVAQYSGDSNNSPANGEVEPFNVAMPEYSGKPFYFNAGGGTQDAWLDYIPPTYSLKMNAYISNGHTSSIVEAKAGLYCDMVSSDKVNITLYLGTSQPIQQLKIDIGFYYQGTYYDMGSATLYNIPKSSANKPYEAIITIDINKQTFVQGYAPLTIPQGSIMSVTTTAPDYDGRITLYYGPGQLSQVNF